MRDRITRVMTDAEDAYLTRLGRFITTVCSVHVSMLMHAYLHFFSQEISQFGLRILRRKDV